MMSKTPSNFWYRYLRYATGPGAPSDDRDLNIDGSTTPSTYEYICADRHMDLSRFTMFLLDGSVNPGDFGGISGALTNGCKLEIIDTDGSTVLLDFNNGETIKQNVDFIMLAGVDAQPSTYTGDDLLAVRFTVSRAGSMLRLRKNQIVRFTIQDDLSGITLFRIMVQGVN